MRIITMKFISAICFSILAFAAATANAQVCQPAPVNLVSWYSGDGNALDSRSRNNATLLNGATFAAGESGQAFSFNGTSSFVQINNDSVLDFGTGDFSVELWFNLNTTSGDQTLFQKRLGNFPNTQEYLLESNNGNLRFLVRDTTANENNLEVAGMITPNTWNHFAAVRQGNNSKIYFNGNLVGNQTTGTNINTGTGGTAVFGKLLDFDLRFFNGRIDEAALYNRALSATEIAAITNAGTAGKCKPTATVAPTGLVGWWAGDGNANDIAGTNNGTLQNGATFAIGRVGQGFTFDGVNAVLATPPSTLNNAFSALSIEAWVNPATHGTDGSGLFGKTIASNTNTDGFGLRLLNGVIQSDLRLTGGDARQTFGSALPLNAWSHVVLTYDGTNVRAYLNGVQVGGNLPASGTVRNSANSGICFFVGGDPGPACAPDSGFGFDGKIDEASIHNRALTDAEITSIVNAGIAGKLKQTTTNGTTATVGDATVTFSSAATRTTQEIPLLAGLFPVLPMANATGLVYDIASNVSVSNPLVCFNLPSFTPAQFAGLRIFHLEAGVWQSRTAAMNTFPALCTTGLTSLSPFAIGINAPTAASVSIGGRIHYANGKPIARARISLTDSSGAVRYTLTNFYGFYRFDDVPAGETYIISASRRFIQFTQNSQVRFIGEDDFGIDFVAE